jgi:uncharacterized protein YceK
MRAIALMLAVALAGCSIAVARCQCAEGSAHKEMLAPGQPEGGSGQRGANE